VRERTFRDIVHKTEAVHVAAYLGDALIQILFYLGKARGFTVSRETRKKPDPPACLVPGLVHWSWI